MEEYKRNIRLLDDIVYEVIKEENIPVNFTTENFAEAQCRTVARLSQSKKSFKKIVKEVLSEEGFDKEKIASFHNRITLATAHHSIEQHGNVTLCFENTTMLATNKYCENKRISSYLEKSTRYQDFSKPCYLVPKELDENKELKQEYIETMNFLFETYTKILPKIIRNIKEELNKQGITELDEKTIKKKAFDSARYILPACAYTNFAMTTNSQVFRSLIVDLLSINVLEFNKIGEEMQKELVKVYPSLLAKSTYSINNNINKLRNNSSKINTLSIYPNNKNNIKIDDYIFENISNNVKLINNTEDADKLIVYNYLLNLGYNVTYKDKDVYLDNNKLNKEEIDNYIIDAFSFDPTDYRPHRALELARYSFEGIIDFGAWRDLHRNRMLTWVSSNISPEFGYQIPIFMSEDTIEDYIKAFKKVYTLWVKLLKNGFSKEFAQYVCPLGTNAKILYTLNARELDHIGKTRTTKHAHFSYREFVHKCINKVKLKTPNIGQNLKDYYDNPINLVH